MPSNDPSANGSNGHLPEPIPNGNGHGALIPLNGHARHELTHPVSVRPAVLSMAPNAPALLRALRRRWLLAVCLAIPFAAAVFAGVWFFLPPAKATISAKIHIPANKQSILGQNSVLGNESTQTQAALVKSRLVLNATLNDPKVVKANPAVLRDRDTLSWLEQEIKVDFPAGPEILRVSMVGDDTEELVILVDALVDAYMKEFHRNQNKDLSERIETLEKIARKRDDWMKRLQDQQRVLAEPIGAGGDKAVQLRQERAQQFLASEEKELLDRKRELAKLLAQRGHYVARRQVISQAIAPLAAAPSGIVAPVWPQALVGLGAATIEVTGKDEDGPTIDPSLIDKVIENKSAMVILRQQEAYYDGLIETNKRKAKDGVNSSLVQDQIRQRNGIRKQIEDLRKELHPKVEEELRAAARKEAKARLAILDEQIKELKELLAEQISSIDTLAKEAKVFNKNNIDLEILKPEIKLAIDSYTRVATMLDQLRIEQESGASVSATARARKLEDASVYRAEELPRKFRFAGLGAAGAFGLVLLLVAYLEFRSRRIDSVDQVVHGLGMRLMGTLPANPTRIHQRLLSPGSQDAHWSSMLTESVDSARTMLLHAARAGGVRIVMVTSAVGGEGKTSLATHLAASLARAGRKTLLLDCDLRNPAAHRLFNLLPAPGFSELLRGEVSAADAIQPTGAAGLSMITAGRCDAEALHVLAQDGARKIFEQLRPQFDFVVVDSSPILPVADSLLIAQHVDGVLFAVLREVSRLPKVYAAYQRLAMLGVPILGAVVNGTLDDQYSYGSRTVTVAGGQI
jgi:capsular exopolysaccharide synthesis family protein